MTFETERLILRPWEESDAEDLYELAKDERVGPATGWNPHTSVENSLEIIRTILSEPGTYAICFKEDGRPIGDISLMVGEQSNIALSDKDGELGFWLGVPFWGQGIMPEAMREMIRYAFEDLGLEALWCGYFDGNEKSSRVQEKCGFRYIRTEKDIYWKATGEIKTEHISRLTKEEWLDARGAGA